MSCYRCGCLIAGVDLYRTAGTLLAADPALVYLVCGLVLASLSPSLSSSLCVKYRDNYQSKLRLFGSFSH
jgi:hypothetical protein